MPDSSNTQQEFINRLTKIVEAILVNDQFGVKELAAKSGLSRSHIHRRLKTICNKSVSQFIREIRLEKAKEFLEEGNLTVSEIAFKVGFGSPTYFIKSFHDYFGYPPGEYIKYASEYSETNKITKNSDSNKPEVNKTGIFLKWIVSAFIIISIVVAIYFIFQTRNTKESLERSIAILPLNYAGNDPEVQILADGIVEDILNRLSQLPTLIVKSRNSSEIYRNTEKLTPEIAKELSVSYLGEGTIIKEGEKVRIYIQLIDAVNDKHIWSQQFDNDLSGIFDFISDVSQQIAKEIGAVLSENDAKQMGKVYTENTEAYQMYRKGRYFWHLRGEQNQNLNLSMNYFNQALELDSTYALAYSGLADVYLTLPFYSSFPNDEGYTKTIHYANKALSIDSKLDKPHAAIAAAEFYFKWNWSIAEKEFKKALELNPNNADVYLFYASYLHKVGKLDEARENANKAIELDPNAIIKYWVSTWLYYDEGKFNESIKASEKLLEFDEDFQMVYIFRFKSYFRLNEYDNALQEYLKFLKLSLDDTKYMDQINTIYEREGIPGILENEINRLLNQPENIDQRRIAIWYGLLNNKDSALVHLEKAFIQNQGISTTDLKVHYDFRFLHGNPRFNTLLKKMNLPVD